MRRYDSLVHTETWHRFDIDGIESLIEIYFLFVYTAMNFEKWPTNLYGRGLECVKKRAHTLTQKIGKN